MFSVVDGDADQEQKPGPDARLKHHLSDTVGRRLDEAGRHRAHSRGPRSHPSPAPKVDRPGHNDERAGVSREEVDRGAGPCYYGRRHASDEQQAHADRAELKEEYRGHSDQSGIEAIDSRDDLGLVVLQNPRRGHANRGTHDRRDRHPRRIQCDPQNKECAGQRVSWKKTWPIPRRATSTGTGISTDFIDESCSVIVLATRHDA